VTAGNKFIGMVRNCYPHAKFPWLEDHPFSTVPLLIKYIDNCSPYVETVSSICSLITLCHSDNITHAGMTAVIWKVIALKA
jgi:hypothetical protein